MGLHIVGNPNDYGGDNDGPDHGKDTQMYVDLNRLRNLLAKWLEENRKYLFNDEMITSAEKIIDSMDQLAEEIGVPL